MNQQFFKLISVIFLVFILGSVYAAVPNQKITIQGILKDNSGDYLNGNYNFDIKIVNSSGTMVWDENHNGSSVPQVSAVNGLFTTILGDYNAFSNATENIFVGDYNVCINVNSAGWLSPCTLLSSYPSSFSTKNAGDFNVSNRINTLDVNVGRDLNVGKSLGFKPADSWVKDIDMNTFYITNKAISDWGESAIVFLKSNTERTPPTYPFVAYSDEADTSYMGIRRSDTNNNLALFYYSFVDGTLRDQNYGIFQVDNDPLALDSPKGILIAGGDVNIENDLNVVGDIRFGGQIFGDGSQLTNIADINNTNISPLDVNVGRDLNVTEQLAFLPITNNDFTQEDIDFNTIYIKNYPIYDDMRALYFYQGTYNSGFYYPYLTSHTEEVAWAELGIRNIGDGKSVYLWVSNTTNSNELTFDKNYGMLSVSSMPLAIDGIIQGILLAGDTNIIGDLNVDDSVKVKNDLNVGRDLNVVGDIRFGGQIFGDGSQLTGVTASADVNNKNISPLDVNVGRDLNVNYYFGLRPTDEPSRATQSDIDINTIYLVNREMYDDQTAIYFVASNTALLTGDASYPYILGNSSPSRGTTSSEIGITNNFEGNQKKIYMWVSSNTDNSEYVFDRNYAMLSATSVPLVLDSASTNSILMIGDTNIMGDLNVGDSVKVKNDLSVGRDLNVVGTIAAVDAGATKAIYINHDGTDGFVKTTLGNITLDSETDIIFLPKIGTATVGNTTYNSPDIVWQSSAWDTDGSEDTWQWKFRNIPTSAATTSSILYLISQKNVVGETNQFLFSSSGSFTSTSTISSGIGVFSTSSSGATGATLRGTVADGAAAIGAKIGNTNALTTSGAKALVVYSDNMSTEAMSLTKEAAGWTLGSLNSATITSLRGVTSISVSGQTQYALSASSAPTIKGFVTDGATAVGTITDTSNILNTSGSKLHSFRNSTTEKAHIDKNGSYVTSEGSIKAKDGNFSNDLNVVRDANFGRNVNIAGKLYVGGTEMTVPDYVFEDDYYLMDLSDLNTYIKENKHLPGIQSAKETDVIDVVDRQNKLLEKIEELTLHLIQQDNSITKLKKIACKKNPEEEICN